MDASRVIVCAPNDLMLFEIPPADMWVCEEYAEINGQHYLEIVTTRVLEKEQRIIVFDEREYAHEYVVASENKEHANGSVPFGRYTCPWSLQHDACLWVVSRMVGTETPRPARFALEAALSGTSRWTVGTVTQMTTGGASMYQMSGWEALTTLVRTWGGEIDANVTVGLTGVTSRTVSLYAQMGEHTAKRRFDYARDLTAINRRVEQTPVACRIIPRGKGEQVGDGYGRKITIEDVNGGIEWLQNDDAAEDFKLPDGNGGWEYPIVYVDNQDIDDKQKLKDWALSVLDQYTTPLVSYDMSVQYLYHENLNPYGTDLGDVVQVVDPCFGEVPLRIEARVTSIRRNRLDRSKSEVTVSNNGKERSLASSMASMGKRIESLTNASAGTAEYLANILNNINAEINALGGWTYIVAGQGLRTYDVSVSDPLVGAEAHRVTEMKGGTLRFANTKTAQGEWEWKNVITADGYMGLAAIIARITSGFIGSADEGSYWDLDNHELYIGGRTDQEINEGIDATITGNETQYIQTSSRTTPPTQSAEGWSTSHPDWQADKYIWQRTKTTYGSGEVSYSDPVCTSGANGGSVTVSKIEYGTSVSASTQPSSWSTTEPQSLTKGTWLWVKTTYSNNSTATTKAYVGTDGTPAYTYSVGCNPSALVRSEEGVLTPSQVTFSATRAQGTGNPSSYAGRFIISEYDGSNWSTKYTSSADEASKAYSPTATARVVRCNLYLAGGTTTLLDTQSVPIASDGTNGRNGLDAYTVILTNESHTFAASTSAAIASSTTSQIIAYKGATQVAATIGTITGAPTGMSTAITNNGKTTAGFTVTVTTSLTTRQGVLTIPVTVDGNSFSLKFSWSLALAGADGVSITGVTEYYARNNSTTAPDDSAFGTSVLTPTSSQRYVWNYESIAYSSGNPTKTAKHIVAVFGDTGAAGRGISGIADYYAINNSTTAPADSAFSTSVKTPTTTNPYLWNYEVISYTTGNPTTTAKRIIGVYGSKGDKGNTGEQGVGMSSISPQYYLSTSASSATGGSWVDEEPLWQSGRYIWQRYHIIWDNGSDSYTDGFYAEALTDAAATAHHADEGAWVEVTDVAVRIEFAVTASDSSAPDSANGNWSTTATLPKSDERLWKRDVVTMYHGDRETYEVRNVESVTTYNANLTEVVGQYYLSTSASSATGGSWSSSCPSWSSGKTIWTRARTRIGSQYSYTTSKACAVSEQSSATDMAHSAFDRVQEIETGFHVFDDRIQFAIRDAARSATDYIQYENGELSLGATDSAVRNVMTNTRNAFRTAAGDIAYFGLDSDGLWRLFIENARITDMLRFGDFAWIARQNGNMTIKWMGA